LPTAVSAQRIVHWQAEAIRKTTEDELLANGDIEEGSGTPSDWYASASGATWDSVIKRTGYRSLKLEITDDVADWRSAYFAVTGNREYRIQGLFLGHGSNQCFLTIRWFSNSDGTGFISENNTAIGGTYDDWTLIVPYVQSPGNAQSADLMFRCPSNTTVSINGDDFSVRMLW
jgi:hypothetical protein